MLILCMNLIINNLAILTRGVKEEGSNSKNSQGSQDRGMLFSLIR
ncbi:hypothetical protein Hdeb2414_s0017g00507281 [Helianthus debilis subsp. tardiflorus]